MNWLITGGCGFIGTALISAIRAMGGHRVRVLDNLTVGTREDLRKVAIFEELDPDRSILSWDGPDITLVVGDISDSGVAERAAAGADIIVHLAANTGVQPSIKDPQSDCRVNVLGTLNMLEAARHGRVQRFVFASSGAPLAGNPPPLHEELAARPIAPYGASKLAGEGYCSAYNRTFGVETVVLRFGNVYGPLSKHKSSVVAKFIKTAISEHVIEIYGDGNQTRDFIYIDDLIDAVYRAATISDIGGEVFQIASSAECTINELANTMIPLLEAALGTKIRVIHAAALPGDARRNFSDTRKAQERLGWKPSTDRAEGLRKTISWFYAILEKSKLH